MMHEVEKSQKEFNRYIEGLPPDDYCKYAEPLGSIALFCNSHFRCRFQNKLPLRHRGTDKLECNRVKFMRLRKIL